jgi:hypothetical protein
MREVHGGLEVGFYDFNGEDSWMLPRPAHYGEGAIDLSKTVDIAPTTTIMNAVVKYKFPAALAASIWLSRKARRKSVDPTADSGSSASRRLKCCLPKWRTRFARTRQITAIPSGAPRSMAAWPRIVANALCDAVAHDAVGIVGALATVLAVCDEVVAEVAAGRLLNGHEALPFFE